MGVFIYSVGMEEVKLHLALNGAPGRQISRHHPMFVHQRQGGNATRVAEDFHKYPAAAFPGHQRLRLGASGPSKCPQSRGINSLNVGISGHMQKQPDDLFRIVKQCQVQRLDKAAATLIVFIYRLDFQRLGVPQGGALEQLQQHLVELHHPPYCAVIALHHLLDRQLGGIFVAHQAGDLTLQVKQQTVFVTA